MAMKVYGQTINVSLHEGPDLQDITRELERIVLSSGVIFGSLQVSVVGSTGSVTTIEHEPGVIEDLKQAIERIAPPGMEYAHELAWHDGNGHSHVQAALVGPSINAAVRDGGLSLGAWQQVVVINHDNKPRTRKVDVTVIGEAS